MFATTLTTIEQSVITIVTTCREIACAVTITKGILTVVGTFLTIIQNLLCPLNELLFLWIVLFTNLDLFRTIASDANA